MSYQERLAAFEALASKYIPMQVRWHEMDAKGVSHTITACRAPVSAGHAECACCGTKRLKWVWPVRDSDCRYLSWIGEECWKNLEKHGKLGAYDGFVEEVTS